MVKIRLTRMGAKQAPFYRIVAMDSRKARDGQYIEKIGHYNPMVEPAEIVIDEVLAKKWLDCGAQCTETVAALFVKKGIIAPKKAVKKADKKDGE